MKNTSADESAVQISNKSIWIPSFLNKKNYNFYQSNNSDCNSLIKDLKNTSIENCENGDHKYINIINESYNSIFRYDVDYDKNPILNPSEDDIVINNTFLISVINLDVLADSHISTVFLSVIDKELWIES